MMIYINGRFLLQHQTGVNRFAYELTKAIISNGVPVTIVCPNGEICNDYDVTAFNIKRFGFGASHFWEQLILPFFFLMNAGVLVSFTGLGPVLLRRKIITIHDLAFYKNPSWYSKLYVLFYKLMTPLCAKTSKCILTVSEFSKKEIHTNLKVALDKVFVLYNAVSDKFKTSDHRFVYERYILAVSTMDPRKNFKRLVDAFMQWDGDAQVKLYLVGGKNPIFASGDIVENESIKWLGRVSDEELVRLYQNAECFVYPSLYEGFGIPPLEAMASGVPVIVSDIPPLREVCGDAALYVNPIDIASISSAFTQINNDVDLKKELIQRGKERCGYFSWANSAAKFIDIIKMIR